MKILPTFDYEIDLWKKGLVSIAGIDEVGRGAFAGPVVTAAVIFSPFCRFSDKLKDKIDDSKRLSAKNREDLCRFIKEEALCYSIDETSLPIINQHGIGKAVQHSFDKSLKSLCHRFDHILSDAFPVDTYRKDIQTPVIHGDRLSISIAAASIIAKVYRDDLMIKLHDVYPLYAFDQHKGYGTLIHRGRIREHGLSNQHRTSFNLGKYS